MPGRPVSARGRSRRAATSTSRSTARRAITASRRSRGGRSRSSSGAFLRHRRLPPSVDRFAAGGLNILLHNFYVPAGGDEPDPDINPKFRHKLDFIEEMRAVHAESSTTSAPPSWSATSTSRRWSTTSGRTSSCSTSSAIRRSRRGLRGDAPGGDWVDLMRQVVPADQKLYTWWSYRARDWALSDRGRRLDHIWSSANLSERLAGIEVLREARGWDRPSDHVPVIARFDLD